MSDLAPQCAAPVAGEPAACVVPLAGLSHPEPPAATTLIALFEAEESSLLAYAISLVQRRSVAEELVQDAFLRLHELWEQIENPRAWLYRSLRNMALNHLRDHRREAPLDEAADPPAGSATSASPDDELGRMEAIGTVRMLLADLAPDDQALIRMKYHEDLKYAEISARTGLGVGNVGYKLHHLLKGLADALRHAGIEGSRG
jgi:RNA polymerase sigma-70 factor (ECF subfamily)